MQQSQHQKRSCNYNSIKIVVHSGQPTVDNNLQLITAVCITFTLSSMNSYQSENCIIRMINY